MKALIFGASGQDGHYLSKVLEKNSIQTFTSSRKSGDFAGDIADQHFVEKVLTEVSPQYVFHLAANSTVAHHAIFDNHDAISSGTLNILEWVKNHNPKTKVFFAGSALQFKNQGKPIDEDCEFVTNNPYNIARLYSVHLARYYREQFGIKTYFGYFFHHDSPLRAEKHINMKVVKFVKDIAQNPNSKLEIANLNVQKEFNHAEDLMEAVMTLVEQDDIFEVVIGSGVPHSIEEWVKYCFEKLGHDYRDYVVKNEDLIVPDQIIVSNPQKLRTLGWEPRHDIYQLADAMLNA